MVWRMNLMSTLQSPFMIPRKFSHRRSYRALLANWRKKTGELLCFAQVIMMTSIESNYMEEKLAILAIHGRESDSHSAI
jgi:hypothetical protein